jgi:AraC-like DNA-binding protein
MIMGVGAAIAAQGIVPDAPEHMAAIGVSAGHLAHLFPAELCMTVKEVVTKVRIEVAKQLLYDRSDTLEHIAEQVGFSDASHLSRVFLQFAGHRPGNYRHRIMSTYRAFRRRDHNGSIDT